MAHTNFITARFERETGIDQHMAQRLVQQYFEELSPAMILYELQLRLSTLPWREYGAADLRIAVPNAAKTIPLRGIDLRFATRPGGQVIVLTDAAVPWDDKKLEREIGTELAKFRNSEYGRPRVATAEDVNLMLNEPQATRKR